MFAASNGLANVYTVDDLFCVDLGNGGGAALESDDWALTSSHSTTTTDGQTATMDASDSIVEHTITAATGVTQEIMVRRTDDNNAIIVRMSQAGSTIAVIEKNAGTEVSKSSTAQTWTNGTKYRVLVRCVGSNIRTTIDDGSEKNNATSTFNQTGVLGAKVSHAGTDLATYVGSVAITPPVAA
jgi:hypothetical protein